MALASMAAIAVTACQASTNDNAVLELRNDLGSRVVLTACEDFHCHHAGGTVKEHVEPGGTLPVNVGTDGVVTYYRVVSDSSGPAKCLSLAASGSSQDSLVSLSSAVDCSQSSRVSFPAGVATTHGPSLVNTVVGWGFYLLLLFGGLASIVATTVFAYRRLRAHGVADVGLVLATLAVAVAAFMGLWVVADVYWLGRGVVRLFRRVTPRTA